MEAALDQAFDGNGTPTLMADRWCLGIRDLQIEEKVARVIYVTVNGHDVELKHDELNLLLALAEKPREVHAKGELNRRFGFPVGGLALHDVVQRLRSKLGPGYVVNCWGVGYSLTESID